MISYNICSGCVFRIAVGITILLLLLAGGASAQSDSETDTFLSLINNHRVQNNLGMLNIDELLQNSANWMSNDMLANCMADNYACSHTDSTGRTFDKRLGDFGYPVGITAAAGENLAWGYNGGMTTSKQAFNAWKNSPGHNANMLSSSYTAIGISRSCNGGECAWVTDFGSQVVKPFKTSLIISYYRGLGNKTNVVETTDLLKASDDWRNNLPPSGFTSPITTQQLLALADEWPRSE